MYEQEAKEKYKELKLKAIIFTIIFIVLTLPRLFMGFTGTDSVLGLTYEAALIPQAVGLVIYCYFFFRVYKCPNCKKYPGNGWSLKSCKSCSVGLS